MNVSLDRLEFLQAARKLCKIAPQSSTATCLTGILLEADAENFEVTMTATNLEVSMSYTLSAAVRESGKAVVNAVLFTDMLRLLGEPTVKLELQENLQMHISGGKAHFVIMTLSAADYPKMQLPAAEHTAEITDLHTLVKSTAFVAAKGNSNLTLKCVKLEIAGNTARTIGTDGARLMTCKKALEGSNTPLTLLISADCFSLLASMVEDTEKLTLECSARYAVFIGEAMTFITRLGTGSYVDVDSVLQGIQGIYEAFVDAKELHAALDTLEAGACASDQAQMVFTLAGISFSCDGQHAKSRSQATAQVTSPMPPEGFYYPLKNLSQGIAVMSGLLKLTVSANGFLLVSNEEQTLLQSPLRPKAKSAKLPPKAKTEKKTKTTKKAADKAA